MIGYEEVSQALVWCPMQRDLVTVTGKHRTRFLNAMVSNALKGLPAGSGTRAAFCSVKGKIVADLRILVREESYLLDLAPGTAAGFVPAITHYRVAEKVKFAIDEKAASGLLIGPGAAELVPGTGLRHVQEGELTLIASDLGGLPAVQLVGPADAIAARVAASGAVQADESLLPLLRIERGAPVQGVDFDDGVLLHETGLVKQLVSFTRGCYPGQEIVARVDSRGAVNRQLCALSADRALVPGESLSVEGKVIGRVTSAAHSPRFGHIGLGYVRRPHWEPGQNVAGAEGPVTVRHRIPGAFGDA